MAIKDYYVNNNTGLDTNDGLSPATAWKWFQRAFSDAGVRANGTDSVVINCTSGGASVSDASMQGVSAQYTSAFIASSITIKGDGVLPDLFDATRFTMAVTDMSLFDVRSVMASFSLEDMQAQVTLSAAATSNKSFFTVVSNSAGAGARKLKNVRVQAIQNSDTFSLTGIGWTSSNATSPDNDINNVIVEFSGSGAGVTRGIYRSAGNVGVYNSLVRGAGTGFNTSLTVLKNCIAVQCPDSFFGGDNTLANCFSDDAAGDANVTHVTDWNAVFTDLAAGNFVTKSSSPHLIRDGVDVSAENGGIITDLVGTARGTTWDVGPYQYVSTTSGHPLLDTFNSSTIKNGDTVSFSGTDIDVATSQNIGGVNQPFLTQTSVSASFVFVRGTLLNGVQTYTITDGIQTDTVSLTVTPETGKQFVSVTGAVSGTANILQNVNASIPDGWQVEYSTADIAINSNLTFTASDGIHSIQYNDGTGWVTLSVTTAGNAVAGVPYIASMTDIFADGDLVSVMGGNLLSINSINVGGISQTFNSKTDSQITFYFDRQHLGNGVYNYSQSNGEGANTETITIKPANGLNYVVLNNARSAYDSVLLGGSGTIANGDQIEFGPGAIEGSTIEVFENATARANQDTTYTLKYWNQTDPWYSFTHTVVNSVNSPPIMLSALGDLNVYEQVLTTINVATAFSGATSYSIAISPPGSGITQAGAVLSSTFGQAQVEGGPYTISVTAANGFGSVSDAFVLTVLNVLQPPLVVAPMADKNAIVGQPFSASVGSVFSGVATYSVTGLPAGTGLSLVSGTLQGTPNSNDLAASPLTITAIATNDDGSVSDSFLMNVTATITPPIVVDPPVEGTVRGKILLALDYRNVSPVVHAIREGGIIFTKTLQTTAPVKFFAGAEWAGHRGWITRANVGLDLANNPYASGLEQALVAIGINPDTLVKGWGIMPDEQKPDAATDLTVNVASLQPTLGTDVEFTATALDADSNDQAEHVRWYNLTTNWNTPATFATGPTYRFQPEHPGFYSIKAELIELNGRKHSKTVSILLDQTQPDYGIQLIDDTLSHPEVEPIDDGASFAAATLGAAAMLNQGAWGSFEYFEAELINSNAAATFAVGLSTRLNGTQMPGGRALTDVSDGAGCLAIQTGTTNTLAINGADYPLTTEIQTTLAAPIIGFAVDSREKAENPTVYVIKANTVIGTFTLQNALSPVHPMAYATNTTGSAPGSADIRFNGGQRPFSNNPATALTAAGVPVTAFRAGWGIHAL